jgi:hypothetical protein
LTRVTLMPALGGARAGLSIGTRHCDFVVGIHRPHAVGPGSCRDRSCAYTRWKAFHLRRGFRAIRTRATQRPVRRCRPERQAGSARSWWVWAAHPGRGTAPLTNFTSSPKADRLLRRIWHDSARFRCVNRGESAIGVVVEAYRPAADWRTRHPNIADTYRGAGSACLGNTSYTTCPRAARAELQVPGLPGLIRLSHQSYPPEAKHSRRSFAKSC